MMNVAVARSLAAIPRRVYGATVRRHLSALVSVDVEFPGIPSVTPQVAKASAISISTLKNGLIVVTEGACSTSTVTLTYPKAGSANEMMDEQGAALTNKCMNFKSGSGISTMLINRTIEDQGGFPFTTVDRNCAVVGYTVVPEKALELVPLLAVDCSFEKWDVRDVKELVYTESAAASESAQIVLTENLYAAAYGPQSPAGRPLYGTACSTGAIKSFRSRAYGLNGAVLSATGVKDHGAFCTEAESMLTDSPAGTSDAPAAMTYLGGESRVAVPSSGIAHVTLAFAGPASPIVADVIVQFLNISGGDAGVSAYSVPGLVGMYACGEASSALANALTSTAKTTVSGAVIKRAKNLAKAQALFALDGGSKSLASEMTASVLESTNFASPADVAKAYDAVTEKQFSDSLAAMLKSNPSLAAVGDISALPYQATFAANLK